jgi:Protein of unknown function (DUF4239)
VLYPLVNGLVVPAVALLFATLTSTTVSTLRQRQVDVRRAINMEAGELRAIECLLDAIPAGPVQDQCRDYVSTRRQWSSCIRRFAGFNALFDSKIDSRLVIFLPFS